MSAQDEPDSCSIPLLTWEEVHQNLLLSIRRTASGSASDSLAAQNIASLLSASSYPLLSPERSNTPQAPLQPQTKQVEGPKQSSKRSRSDPRNADGLLPRKRGRPRKPVDEGEDPNQRRRMQIRLAQRAYRSRKDAGVSYLQSRVLLLEATVEQISTALLSVSNQLMQPESLASNPQLVGRLRDTVQTCLSLANTAAKTEKRDMAEGTSPLSEESHSSSETNEPRSRPGSLTWSPASQVTSTTNEGIGTLYAAGFKAASGGHDPPEVASLDLSAFIERLHFACLYEGYSALCNASIGLDRLQRPFRFIFGMMDRKRVTSYFEACLHAKASQKRLDEWEEVPYFRIGGAGTHYPGNIPRSSTETLPRSRNIQDPVPQLPQEIRQELDGEWFDIHDLEGFLQERGVSFVVGHAKRVNNGEKVVNAACLIQELLKTGVCLGRTPGFRRKDVEVALQVACTYDFSKDGDSVL